TAALGNGGAGVAHFNTASGNQTTANVIAFNVGSGVQVGAGPGDLSRRNAIRGNAIFANGALGIDLGNDGVSRYGTPPPGPSYWQNSPVLDTASSDGATTTVSGTLQSTPSTTFFLEFFVNTALDPSGFGQGEKFLDRQTVSTDATGLAPFTVTLPVGT